ncbi:MAG: hypothetical protein M0R51_12560, partial [Clostridia bacterium]|nr:hypothetical protein [Clostridia bacterium]
YVSSPANVILYNCVYGIFYSLTSATLSIILVAYNKYDLSSQVKTELDTPSSSLVITKVSKIIE